MKEEKYYTPSIEEFRVGFEYEEFVKGEGWVETILEDLEQTYLNKNGACLDWDDYRVKYLDREDIESLGYVLSRTNVSGNGYDEYLHKLHNSALPPGIDFNKTIILKNGNKIVVHKKYQLVFNGTIKNKSELKVLLKQLGI